VKIAYCLAHVNNSFLFSPFRFHKKAVKNPFLVHFGIGVDSIVVHGYSDISLPMQIEQQQFVSNEYQQDDPNVNKT
jgi:hypothetical protein